MTWWHGSPTGGLETLEPRLDSRTGHTGVFVASDPFQPVVFSLLANRAESNVDIFEQGTAIWAFFSTQHPILDRGWVYRVEPEASAVVEWKPGRYYIDGPARVVESREWVREDLLFVAEPDEDGWTHAFLRIPV